MYTKKDLQQDIRRGKEIISLLAAELNIKQLGEEFSEECDHPDGITYWRDAINASNHDIDKFAAAVAYHFLRWCAYPDTDSIPTLVWRSTETREAEIPIPIETRMTVGSPTIACPGCKATNWRRWNTIWVCNDCGAVWTPDTLTSEGSSDNADSSAADDNDDSADPANYLQRPAMPPDPDRVDLGVVCFNCDGRGWVRINNVWYCDHCGHKWTSDSNTHTMKM